MKQQAFSIPNITCGHCVMTIKSELQNVPGVTKVDGDQLAKTITVEWDSPANTDQITAALKEINYPAT